MLWKTTASKENDINKEDVDGDGLNMLVENETLLIFLLFSNLYN